MKSIKIVAVFSIFVCLLLFVIFRSQLLMRPEAVSIEPISNVRLNVSSPAFVDGGTYPVEFTGDGEGVSPPLEWSESPEGTKCFALHVWHVPGPGSVKSYWVVYNIPGDVSSLKKNSHGVGIVGYNDKNRTEYDPMKSKGPGVKEYHITVYALSAEPHFTGTKVTRTELLKAIKAITLAEGTISYKYERTSKR